MLNNKWNIYNKKGEYRGYVHTDKELNFLKNVLFYARDFEPYAINPATNEILRLKRDINNCIVYEYEVF